MDYLAELGTLGLGSRLRRLSETFFDETTDVYRFYNFDLEPRYFGLVSFLHRYGPVSVTEAAKALHLTHPAISQMSKDLLKGDWILVEADPADERRRLLRLSEKGNTIVAELEPIWQQIQAGVDELLGDQKNEFLSLLGKIEEALRDTKLSKKVVRCGKAENAEAISYCAWKPEFAQSFHDLNEEWVRRFFSYEEKDADVLKNPEARIRQQGGEVFFALSGGRAIGTCALLKPTEDSFELVKMAVSRSHQGQGIGQGLLDFAINWATVQGATKVTLETNTQLAGALKLYQRSGFKSAQSPHPSSYERADVYMERAL